MKNVVKSFENEFQDEVLELLILPKETVGGAGVVGDYLRPSLTFMASVQDGKMLRKTGRLEWLVKQKEGERNFGYPFQAFVPYLVKVRPCIAKELPPYALAEMNHRFMLLEVLEENPKCDVLSALGKKMMEPVVIKDAVLGTFLLNRRFDWFEGEIRWLGEDCMVKLAGDEDGNDTATGSFAILKRLHENLEEWDEKLRCFAAKELTDLANDWQQEEDEEAEELTEAAFAKRMQINEISISADGEMEVYFGDDDMFWGHVIIVTASISGEMLDANIAG